MNIKQTKTFELSMDDIKTAITDYMFKTCRENISTEDIKFNIRDIKEQFSTSPYDYEYVVIGHDITVKVEVKED